MNSVRHEEDCTFLLAQEMNNDFVIRVAEKQGHVGWFTEEIPGVGLHFISVDQQKAGLFTEADARNAVWAFQCKNPKSQFTFKFHRIKEV